MKKNGNGHGKKVLVGVWFSADQIDALRETAASLGVTPTQFVRVATEVGLENAQKSKRPSLKAIVGGA